MILNPRYSKEMSPKQLNYLNKNFEYIDGELWQWSFKGTRIHKVDRLNSSGYLVTNIGGSCTMTAHRIIWFLHHGKWPIGLEVDHINGNKLDNRIENLRTCDRRTNRHNSKSVRLGIMPGVFYDKSKKRWKAMSPAINGKQKSLRFHKTLELANQAVKDYFIANGIEIPKTLGININRDANIDLLTL